MLLFLEKLELLSILLCSEAFSSSYYFPNAILKGQRIHELKWTVRDLPAKIDEILQCLLAKIGAMRKATTYITVQRVES